MSVDKGSKGAIGISAKAVQIEYVVNIPGTFCDKYGNEGLKVTLEGVTYRKNYIFQLCSLAMIMQQS